MNMDNINFIIKGHNLAYEVQTIIQVFYPNKHYYQVNDISNDTITIISIFENSVGRAEIYDRGIFLEKYEEFYNDNNIINIKDKKIKVKATIFKLLVNITKYKPIWGILTGIRPAKTVNNFINIGMSKEDIINTLCNKYFVNYEKAELSYNVAVEERKIIEYDNNKDVSLYIGIPFCPTKCLYCSFTSYIISQYKNKIDRYLDALIKEINFISKYILNYNLKTIYIGGGTPTSLNELQFERLLYEISKNFNVNNLSEYTVEAGRVDTISENKLKLLKKYNISRISINPQTMNQKTLDLIGRKHTVEDIKYIFQKARDFGHNNINMDIILGLPKETVKDVNNTMSEIIKLSPENITIHTLAIKRASLLKEKFDLYNFTNLDEMEEMLSLSYNWAKRANFKPYYMYRQKNMIGSFENVGYCKENKECIYNIEIMEENRTIFACGAGATTKLVDKNSGRIERIFNVKSVDDYINRIDEMIKRKELGFVDFE